MFARIQHVIEQFRRRPCPVCMKPIRAGQRTILWQGERAHRRCVVYTPKSKRHAPSTKR